MDKTLTSSVGAAVLGTAGFVIAGPAGAAAGVTAGIAVGQWIGDDQQHAAAIDERLDAH